MSGRRLRWALSCAVFCALVATLTAPRADAAGEDPREVKGRALFAQGEYQAALEVYAALYAENRDPIYLRNIGRCHQKLRQPGKAIDAFEEYVQRAPRLKAAERREIEGYITEMKELKQAQEAQKREATPPERTEASGTAGGGHGAGSTIDAKPQPPPPQPLVITSPPQEQDDKKPLTSKWWFWTGIGGAVVLGTVITVLAIRGGGVERPGCDAGFNCP